MCVGGGGGSTPIVKSYTAARDPSVDKTRRASTNKAKLAALYGMSRTNKTSGMGVQASGSTYQPTAFGTNNKLGLA